MQIGSAYPLDEPMTMEIKGRDLREGIPKAIVVDDQELREGLENVVSLIINAIKFALEKTPPELSADIIDRGIMLTGGSALLKNMDRRIREETQLAVFIADNPLTTVVLGAGKMLDNLGLLKKMSLNYYLDYSRVEVAADARRGSMKLWSSTANAPERSRCGKIGSPGGEKMPIMNNK